MLFNFNTIILFISVLENLHSKQIFLLAKVLRRMDEGVSGVMLGKFMVE